MCKWMNESPGWGETESIHLGSQPKTYFLLWLTDRWNVAKMGIHSFPKSKHLPQCPPVQGIFQEAWSLLVAEGLTCPSSPPTEAHFDLTGMCVWGGVRLLSKFWKYHKVIITNMNCVCCMSKWCDSLSFRTLPQMAPGRHGKRFPPAGPRTWLWHPPQRALESPSLETNSPNTGCSFDNSRDNMSHPAINIEKFPHPMQKAQTVPVSSNPTTGGTPVALSIRTPLSLGAECRWFCAA